MVFSTSSLMIYNNPQVLSIYSSFSHAGVEEVMFERLTDYINFLPVLSLPNTGGKIEQNCFMSNNYR